MRAIFRSHPAGLSARAIENQSSSLFVRTRNISLQAPTTSPSASSLILDESPGEKRGSYWKNDKPNRNIVSTLCLSLSSLDSFLYLAL